MSPDQRGTCPQVVPALMRPTQTKPTQPNPTPMKVTIKAARELARRANYAKAEAEARLRDAQHAADQAQELAFLADDLLRATIADVTDQNAKA